MTDAAAAHRRAPRGEAGLPAPPELRRDSRHQRPGDLRAGRARTPRRSGPSEAERLDWTRPWDTVMEWTPPFVKWFVGGTLNASVNCLDRHVAAGGGDKVAYHWEGEPGDTRTITYRELLDEVCRLANGLRSLGVRKGDRVNIYLGMVPELPIAMLACARIGAPHSVVFGGFSADSLRDRINDAEAKVLITADGAWRRGQVVPVEGERGRSGRGVSEHRARDHAPALRERARVHAGQGHLVPRSGRGAADGVRPRRRWTRRTSCTSSTRAAPRGSRRGSCTRPAATSPRSRRRIG